MDIQELAMRIARNSRHTPQHIMDSLTKPSLLGEPTLAQLVWQEQRKEIERLQDKLETIGGCYKCQQM